MADQLANVKSFFTAVALDGFGVRKYVATERIDPARNFLHRIVMPALWKAIIADDPDYDPLGAPSEAQGTQGVQYFVAFLEGYREWEKLAHPYDEIWHLLWESGQEGCFFDDLVAALNKDAPDWSPAPFEKNGPAVHPNLHKRTDDR